MATDWRLAYLRRLVRDRIYHALGSLGSHAFVSLRWPWPLKKPYQRKRLLLRPPGAGIGDNLMCTPIFREIKRRNPHCHISFVTRHPELFRDNPLLDQVIRHSNSKQDDRALRLGYDHMAPRFTADRLLAEGIAAYRRAANGRLYFGYSHPTPPPRPLIRIMAECVGMEFFDNQLDCAAPVVSEAFRNRVAAIPSPYIVIQPHASDWTPNKEWPADYCRELINALVADYDVVEAGTRAVIGPEFQHPRFHCLAGGTSVSEFVYLVSRAHLFVGPDSGGMHIANAFQVPSVVVFGGYSSPESFAYPRVCAFYTPVDCAPCWLATPCPYDTKCLKMITPQQVLEAVHQTLGRHNPQPQLAPL